ncbi:phosphomannomutase/phosphoglucomutase [Methylobacillus flagellatus]|uniref:phosphomannomutase/phosphoglucomutase n=1 Tax=Methylobacillus flagellatus TaxID=405 RepID=UPI0010F91E17|nr:phosphomannomutase/phosphoglucomutase [Methylobacillus flagellatus]
MSAPENKLPANAAAASKPAIAAEIFKAYDIRGIVDKSLTVDSVMLIGRAIAAEALAIGQQRLCVAYDGRLSGPDLAAALSAGLHAGGVDTLQLGMLTTPMLYFATEHLGTGAGVMVTGSHNPPEYNGLKIVLGHEAISGAAIQRLYQRILDNALSTGNGQASHSSIAPAYFAHIKHDIQLARPMKIAIDAGNGVAGAYAQALFEALGCEVQSLYCEVDGRFPNHHPDPSVPENLQDLMRALAEGDAEIGLAFDGDADRLGVVSKSGEIIYPDRQLMLFADDILQRQPDASVVFDVKCTRLLAPWIAQRGGRPVMWKTGHSLMKAKMRETAAAVGGEMSGHLFFNDRNAAGKARWFGFDDGLYAGARLLELLSRDPDSTARLMALPNSLSTPELHIALQEGEPHRLLDQLQQSARFTGATDIIRIDGLRVEYADGFGLMRASNTTPVIVLRFEADNPCALTRIQSQFRAVLTQAVTGAQLPF